MGSAMSSSMMASAANKIDKAKIERLLAVFNLFQQNDDVNSMVILAMKELKALIPS